MSDLKILEKLNIDEELTKQVRNKQKNYNSIKNNIPLKEDYNFMADLIMMPETKAKYKYLLSVVDLATDEFDIEPLKTKTPEEVLEAFKAIIKRKHIKTFLLAANISTCTNDTHELHKANLHFFYI